MKVRNRKELKINPRIDKIIFKISNPALKIKLTLIKIKENIYDSS